MTKQKKKFIIRCPDCNKKIIGFSEHHAKMNLMIHQRTSERCKELLELKKKWLKQKS